MAIKTEDHGCLKEESVYNPKTGSCRRCPTCRYGEGRNFSQPVLNEIFGNGTDVKCYRHDDLNLKRRVNKCPPCKICPEGYFNNDKNGVTCRRCVVNCMERHRHVTRECTPGDDTVCGSCLKGYYEVYYNPDHPCFGQSTILSPATTLRHTLSTTKIAGTTTTNTTKASTTTKTAGTRKVTVDNTAPLRTFPLQNNITKHMTQRTIFRPEHQEEPRMISATAIIVVFIVILVVLIALIHFKKRRKLMPCRIEQTKQFTVKFTNTKCISKCYTPVVGVEHTGNDLETDAVHSTDGNDEVTLYPRPELSQTPASTIPWPRPELSTVAIGSDLDVGIIPFRYEPVSPNQICECRRVPNRQLCQFNDGADEPIQKGSHILYTVASQICHSPKHLYQNLDISYANIYQIDDDRNRDPYGIKEKDNIVNILNRWVEVKDKAATKRCLCEALCRGGFHHIHENISRV